MEELADQVAARGVRRIDGDICRRRHLVCLGALCRGLGDRRSAVRLRRRRLRPGHQRQRLDADHPPGRPRRRSGRPVPRTRALEYYDFDNRVRTSAGRRAEDRVAPRPRSVPGASVGSIPLHDRGEDMVLGIEDPALYAAQAFRQALENRGIAVAGRTMALHRLPRRGSRPGRPPCPRPPKRTASSWRAAIPRRSSRTCAITAKASQNLHAEMALRAVGRARRGVGSREAGLEDLKAFLGEIGIDSQGLQLQRWLRSFPPQPA